MRQLSTICLSLLLAVAVLVSCKKENDLANNGEVQLLSFGPTGAKHGDTLRFIGMNLDKVTAIQFAGNNAMVEQKDFKQQTPELILLLVPTSAERGNVTLKTPGGDVVSKTQFNLNVKTAATVATMTRTARPGENITITGDYLNWVKRITFNRNLAETTFVSKSQTQLVVRVPEQAQTGPLVLTFSGTDSLDLTTTDTLYVKVPMVTSFSPNPVKHNTNLTITGTDLDLARQVRLPGQTKVINQASFVSQTATQLVVKVDSATVKGKVTLVAPSGVTTVSATDLDVVMPSIATMAPDPVAPNANLTITGTNLDVVKSVSFTGVPTAVSSFVSQSATQLVVTVPTGALTGKLTLNILNSGLTVQSIGDLRIAGSSVPPIILYEEALTSAWKWLLIARNP